LRLNGGGNPDYALEPRITRINTNKNNKPRLSNSLRIHTNKTNKIHWIVSG